MSSWDYLLPDERLTVHEGFLHEFFITLYERQRIWKRRFIEKRPRPWTDDPILSDYKFTNVYRELDRNSQWMIRNILLDDGLTLKDLIWKMMVFRFFNNPETFEFDPSESPSTGDLIADKGFTSAKRWRNGIPGYDEYGENEFAGLIASVRAKGLNPYTTAYLINSQATPGKSRDYCYTHLVIPTLHKCLDRLITTVVRARQPRHIIEYLRTLPAVADFIAHEFYQDFTYIPRYTPRKFMRFTADDYTNVGPGAAVGIRLIFPSTKRGKEQRRAIYRLRDMAKERLEEIAVENGEPMPYVEWDKERSEYVVSGEFNLTLHQIEMWLCEYQKYWKMKHGVGKPRSRFKPRTKDLIVGGL